MDLRRAAIALSLGRAALGVALTLTPERIAVPWVGPRGAEAPTSTLARSVGIRDVALGAGGAVSSLRGDSTASAWLAGAAVCDAGDIAAMLAARDSLPESGVRGTVALAAGSAVLASLAAVAARS
jgi:hypothetical protein